jgi:hypothetical protein
MLKAFANSSGKATDHTMLFNQDGYWLRSRTHLRSGVSCSTARNSP